MMLAWGIKVISAIVFMLIFTQLYSESGAPYGDVGNFYQDSKVLAKYAQKDPGGYFQVLLGINSDDLELHQTHLSETNIWSYGDNGDLLNDNRLIIRINSLIHLISFQVIWVHVLIFAFISFLGLILIYKAFEQYIQHKRIFFFVLFLAPSLSFWGSGLSKECLFVFAFGLFCFAINRLLKKLSGFNLLLLVVGILLLFFNKPHVGIIIFPLSIILLIGFRFAFNRTAIFLGSTGLVALLITLSFTPEKINLVDRLSEKQKDFINLGQGGIFFITDSSFCAFDYKLMDHFKYQAAARKISVNKPCEGTYKLFGQDEFHPFRISASAKEFDVYLAIAPSNSYVTSTPINGSGIQLIKNTPAAIINVVLRPFPTDNGSQLKLFIFLENLLFIGFLIVVLKRKRKLLPHEKAWVFYLVASALVLTLIIGWTTPVFGAIARYKIAPQLLLLIAFFILLAFKKKTV